MIAAMIAVTGLVFGASLWDASETRRGIREGRIREGNALLRAQGGLAFGRKLIITGVPIGIGWLIFALGSQMVAVVSMAILACVFAAVAIFARRAGR
jgi:hypothetical protein